MTEEKSTEKTDEQKAAELNARVKAFNEELLPLLGKYHLALGATPFILPNGSIAARPQVFPEPEKKKEDKIIPA